jgi:hypothetical protein
MRGASPEKFTAQSSRKIWEKSLIAALLVAAVWITYFCFPRVGTTTGINETGKRFLDLDVLLAAGEAVQLGLDPFLPNPLDVYHRPHVYPEWWLVTGKIGLTRADTPWLGMVLTGVTLVSAVLFLRPTRWRQIGLTLLLLVSPALLMAVDRCNNDLVVFVLMCGALTLLSRPSGTARAFAVVLLATATVLKYYPLAATIVLLEARTRREWLGWVLLYGLVLWVAWPSLGLRAALKYPLHPEWLYAFGGSVIFRNLGLVAPPGWLALGFGLMLAVAGAAARREWKTTGREEFSSRDARAFACGAGIVIGCFLMSSSYVYKLIFCLWLLPWLWRSTPSRLENRWRRATLGLLLAVLWGEGILATALNLTASALSGVVALRLLAAGLFLSQLATWTLMACLLRGLIVYVGRRIPQFLAGPVVTGSAIP